MPEAFAAISAILMSRILPALITSSIAQKRGYNPWIGFGAGVVFGWFGLIVFAVVAQRAQTGNRQRSRPRSAARPQRDQTGRNVENRDLWRSEADRIRAEEAKVRAEAERDAGSELLEARERELQRVKDELEAANARANAAREPWIESDPEYANSAFPDALPPDLPRTRFDESDEPKTMESGAED